MSENQSNESPRVLIVDDDENTLEILRRWLAKEGYETVTAEDGQECLDILQKERFDIVLLDVMMPNVDGLQVCEQLRQDPRLRTIPVVLLTAKDDMETRTRGMALGVSEYLTKPINKLELFARLRAQAHTRELDRRMDRTAAAIANLEED
jgi:PleD family two-component response regulator